MNNEPKCKYCWDKGYSTVMSDTGVVKLPCARCPKCQWCGKAYEQHEVDYKDRPTPKVPCGLLKKHFLIKTAIPENARVTCLSIDCPERKSVCCRVGSMVPNGSEGMGYFVCKACGKEYVGGKCKAFEFADAFNFVGDTEVTIKEIVICAAVKTTTGEIIRGHRHNDCLQRMASMGLDYRGRTEGFITSQNRFVDRKEGYQIQIAAGIPSVNPTGYYHDELYSEDLY